MRPYGAPPDDISLIRALTVGGHGGQGLALRVPPLVAAAGYVVAVGLAWMATRSGKLTGGVAW